MKKRKNATYQNFEDAGNAVFCNLKFIQLQDIPKVNELGIYLSIFLKSKFQESTS